MSLLDCHNESYACTLLPQLSLKLLGLFEVQRQNLPSEAIGWLWLVIITGLLFLPLFLCLFLSS